MILVIPTVESLVEMLDFPLNQLQTILVIEYLLPLFLTLTHEVRALPILRLEPGHLELQIPELHGGVQKGGLESFSFLPLLIELALQGGQLGERLGLVVPRALWGHHPDEAVGAHGRVADGCADRGALHCV